MIIWCREEKPLTGNWLNEGFWEPVTSVGFPCSSKNHDWISLLSRWNEAMFVSCLSYFISRAECTLALFPFGLGSLLPAAPLSRRCGHNSMTTSCCSALVLHSHWTTDLGNTWIGCQPARVVRATLKSQLCKLVKIRTLPTVARARHNCEPFLDFHTCQDEENKWRGHRSRQILNLKKWGIKKTFKLIIGWIIGWGHNIPHFHYSQK